MYSRSKEGVIQMGHVQPCLHAHDSAVSVILRCLYVLNHTFTDRWSISTICSLNEENGADPADQESASIMCF